MWSAGWRSWEITLTATSLSCWWATRATCVTSGLFRPTRPGLLPVNHSSTCSCFRWKNLPCICRTLKANLKLCIWFAHAFYMFCPSRIRVHIWHALSLYGLSQVGCFFSSSLSKDRVLHKINSKCSEYFAEGHELCHESKFIHVNTWGQYGLTV